MHRMCERQFVQNRMKTTERLNGAESIWSLLMLPCSMRDGFTGDGVRSREVHSLFSVREHDDGM